MNGLPRQRLLVPSDFSDESLKAIDTALEIATDPKTVHVLHVLPNLRAMDTPWIVMEGTDDETRRQRATEALRDELSDERYADLQVSVRIGDPGQSIVEFAAEMNADMIVLPSHGRTGIKRLLIGSVSERVTRLAGCPVLVLRN